MIEQTADKIRAPLLASIAGTFFDHLSLIFSDDALRILGGVSYLLGIGLAVIKYYHYAKKNLKKHVDNIQEISDCDD